MHLDKLLVVFVTELCFLFSSNGGHVFIWRLWWYFTRFTWRQPCKRRILQGSSMCNHSDLYCDHMLRSSPPRTFVLTSRQVVITTSGAFKSLWSEQDGDLTFLHKTQWFFKLYIYKMMNEECASLCFFFFLFYLIYEGDVNWIIIYYFIIIQ